MTTQRREVLIVGGARTPIGKFQGTIARIPRPNSARLSCAKR